MSQATAKSAVAQVPAHPSKSHPKGCTDANPALIDRLQAMVTGRTDEALNERFGISYNTWRKLIAGEPVRASVLKRLEARIGVLEAQGTAHPD